MLSKLKILTIDGANIVGTLPSELFRLHHLKQMTIRSSLEGMLPSEIGELRSLEKLEVRRDTFDGQIPIERATSSNVCSTLSLFSNSNLIDNTSFWKRGSWLSNNAMPLFSANYNSLARLSLLNRPLIPLIPSPLLLRLRLTLPRLLLFLLLLSLLLLFTCFYSSCFVIPSLWVQHIVPF